MALSESDKRSIREDMVGPVSERVGRVEKKVDITVAEISEIRQDQREISTNMQAFMVGLEQEREERRRSKDRENGIHNDLYEKHNKLNEKVSTVNTAAQVGDASAKGLAIGFGKALLFIVSLGAVMIAALAFAHSRGWLGPAGG